MEEIIVVGRRHCAFKDHNGDYYKGWRIYYTMPYEEVDGLMAGMMFISDERCAKLELPEVGNVYQVIYDRYGKVNKFIAV